MSRNQQRLADYWRTSSKPLSGLLTCGLQLEFEVEGFHPCFVDGFSIRVHNKSPDFAGESHPGGAVRSQELTNEAAVPMGVLFKPDRNEFANQFGRGATRVSGAQLSLPLCSVL